MSASKLRQGRSLSRCLEVVSLEIEQYIVGGKQERGPLLQQTKPSKCWSAWRGSDRKQVDVARLHVIFCACLSVEWLKKYAGHICDSEIAHHKPTQPLGISMTWKTLEFLWFGVKNEPPRQGTHKAHSTSWARLCCFRLYISC